MVDRWAPVEEVRTISNWLREPAEDRKQARERGWVVKEWNDSPGAYHPPHDHPYDHRVVVVEGSMEFIVEAETFRLGKGDALDLPAGVPHEANSDPERGCRYWQLQPPE